MKANSNCGCTGKDGKQKASYQSEQEANDHMHYAMAERNVNLTVYECPYGGGYHLTSNTHAY